MSMLVEPIVGEWRAPMLVLGLPIGELEQEEPVTLAWLVSASKGVAGTMDNKALLLDLIAWVGETPKPYDDVMAAWRTSCPRLQVWEDAVDHGFVVRRNDGAYGQLVDVTAKGRDFLKDNGRA